MKINDVMKINENWLYDYDNHDTIKWKNPELSNMEMGLGLQYGDYLELPDGTDITLFNDFRWLGLHDAPDGKEYGEVHKYVVLFMVRPDYYQLHIATYSVIWTKVGMSSESSDLANIAKVTSSITKGSDHFKTKASAMKGMAAIEKMYSNYRREG